MQQGGNQSNQILSISDFKITSTLKRHNLDLKKIDAFWIALRIVWQDLQSEFC